MVGQASGDYCEGVSEDRRTSNGEVSHDSAHDLEVIEADLAAVEAALARLEAGTYWTDEVTGEPLPGTLLEEHPLLRRRPK